MNQAPVKPGDVLAGKYEVERVLGVGGMGVVVAARHLQLRERVALKFLLPDIVLQPGAVERFEREARAAVRIKSEHVARVSDVGLLDGTVPYMVVEYLDGVDLSQRLARTGPMPMEEAVEYVLQACAAMAEAHSLGIVHRDLKPSNLFLTRRPNGEPLIKVLDFGISKLAPSPEDAPRPSLTTTNGVMGSPLYMSPEQVRSAKNVDARSDIWSLGVILYELLSAHPPFDGRMVPEVIAKIAADPPTPLRDWLPGVDLRLEQTILRCLEKEPAARFPTVAEFAAALLPFGGPRATMTMHRITASLPSMPPPDATIPSNPPPPNVGTAETLDGESLMTARRRNPARTIAIASVTAILCAAGVVIFLAARSAAHPGRATQGIEPLQIDSAIIAVPADAQAPQPSASSSAAAQRDETPAAPTQCVKPLPAKAPPATTSTSPKTPPPASTKGIQELINDRR